METMSLHKGLTAPLTRACPTLLFALLASACGSTMVPGDKQFAQSVEPGTRAPANLTEESLLPMLGAIEPGPVALDSQGSVHAGEVYFAASGRQCQRFSMQTGVPSVACKFNVGWRFVPNVFVSQEATPTPVPAPQEAAPALPAETSPTSEEEAK